ncbi:MAG: ScyD/ScyE family protein [Bacteroidetes bacterium]|nr:ScyD/ScyE family protein [Bacteroidota bacterium]
MKFKSTLSTTITDSFFARFPALGFRAAIWKYIGIPLLLVIPLILTAQPEPELVSSGHTGPVGLEIDVEGNIWVSESGSGNNDSRISVITPSGESHIVIDSLPSYFNMQSMEVSGVWRTRMNEEGDLLALMGFSESSLSNTLTYIDLTDYNVGDPALNHDRIVDTIFVGDYVLGEGFLESNPYDLLLQEDGNAYIVDAAANAILQVDGGGQLSVLSTFDDFENPTPVGPPFINVVPTNIIADGDGYLVCSLTGFPFLEGAARVYQVGPGGANNPELTDLTMLTDLARDPNDGSIIINQFGSFDLMAGGFVPASGRLIRDDQQGNRDTIAQNLPLLSGMAVAPNGDIYVSDLFAGNIWRLAVGVSSVEGLGKDLLDIELSPNPASGIVNIRFVLAKNSQVRVTIHDQLGRELRILQEGEEMAGQIQYNWNGLDGSGMPVPEGMYHVRFVIDGKVYAKSLIRN